MTDIQIDPTLTVCILTMNEKDYIRNALECIKTIYADEIIAIDGYSTDETIDILKEYNVKIIYERSNDNFGNLRTMAISHSTKDWILFIDADKILEQSLCDVLRTRELLKHCQKNEIDVVTFKRKNYINDIFQEQSYPDDQYRLIKNNGKIRYIKRVHEIVECTNKLQSNYHIIHKKSKERCIMRDNIWTRLEKDHTYSSPQAAMAVPHIKPKISEEITAILSNHQSIMAIPHTKSKIGDKII